MSTATNAAAVKVTPASRIDADHQVSLSNILVATDFSPSSETALGYALAIARRYESHVYVAHVILPSAYQFGAPEAIEPTYDLVRRHAEEEMATLLVSGRLRSVVHEVLLEEGLLWPTLASMIQDHSIQLVVIGTHGRTGARKLLLGSAAEEIFRLADVPVMTVGPQVKTEPPQEVKLKRILYATDFTAKGERAAAYALSLAQEHQAELTLLHVIENGDGVSSKNISALRAVFLKRLDAIVPPEARSWCDPACVVTVGNSADEILAVARARASDLIVLGVRHATGFAGHILASRAYKVVCQSECPVLTVRG
ncbi:MAG TPA: universal stress protein [Candidatus Limnocylindrales bacterium]|nr:universal stress protein [Candidatus Limnocylindrales bacterium]